MRLRSVCSAPFRSLVGYAALIGLGMAWACGGAGSSGFPLNGDGGSAGRNDSSFVFNKGGPEGGGSDATTLMTAPDSGGIIEKHDATTITTTVCPTGLQCGVSCTGNTTTTITGKVYDPGGNNALYDVEVYVPQTPLTPLPSGVLTGANACSCGALFESGAVVSTKTGVDGSFKLTNAPVGTSVPLVFQIGKWRRQVNIDVKPCQDNAQLDKSLKLPSTITDPNDSMPQIAISTGALDTLECLLMRIGLPATEYVAGAGGAGHIHIFSGGQDPTDPNLDPMFGSAESPPMTNAPVSSTDLWDTEAHLLPYDILLLSCEGGETYNSNSSVLEQYLNQGGRAFASHYHYVWFAGSLEGNNVPAPPSDWGTNLATWPAPSSASPNGSATVVQTLNVTNKPFQKGAALYQWLAGNGALGIEGAASGQIPIFDENGDVGATNKAQAWLVDQGATDYMSFDTPVNALPGPDGGAPNYCGRAVFADLHVSSDPNFPSDMNPPPSGCNDHPLSPQEKALEFMLFDLSSCVVSDTVTVAQDAGIPPPPPMAK